MWESQALYCPMCGSGLVERPIDGLPRLRCEGCRFILYKNPASAAAAIAIRDDEILLIKRGISPYRGTWTLPAGYEEYEEAPHETVVRETREETGLDVRPYGLYDVLYTRDDPRKRANLIIYLCDVVGGELAGGDDALEARFFPLTELPSEIGFANNRAVLCRLVDEWQRGALTYIPLAESP